MEVCTSSFEGRSSPKQMLRNYLGDSLGQMDAIIDRWHAARRQGNAVQERACEVESIELRESVQVAQRALSRVESRGY